MGIMLVYGTSTFHIIMSAKPRDKVIGFNGDDNAYNTKKRKDMAGVCLNLELFVVKILSI